MSEPPDTPRNSDPAALVVLVLGVLGVLAVLIGVTLAVLAWWDAVRAGEALPPETTVIAATTTTRAVPSTTLGESTTTTSPDAFDLETLVDDSGTLSLAVPAAWIDRSTGNWTRDGEVIGVSVSAATDRAAWIDGWGAPGVFVGASSVITVADAVGDFSSSCRLDSADALPMAGTFAATQWWVACGAEGSDFLVAVGLVGDTVLLVQVVTLADDPPGLAEAIVNTVRYGT